jgi:Fe-S cluster assembly protein SufD
MKTLTKKYYVKAGEERVINNEWKFERPGEEQKMIVKAVVEAGGKLEMKGKILIGKKAVGTEAYLDQRVLLLGEGATGVIAQPELEIECNQVKASHAASIGPADPDQLFYLQARGINREEAIKLIVEAFLN